MTQTHDARPLTYAPDPTPLPWELVHYPQGSLIQQRYTKRNLITMHRGIGTWPTPLLARADAELILDAVTAAYGAEPRDVDDWFGLSYSNFLVLHRSLTQSMPLSWQHRFVHLVEQLFEAYGHLDHPSFKVDTGSWNYPSDLGATQLQALGITVTERRADGSLVTDEDDDTGDTTYAYHDRDGTELDERIACVFAPAVDPIPHYDRGRTHVPRADEITDSILNTTPNGQPDCPHANDPVQFQPLVNLVDLLATYGQAYANLSSDQSAASLTAAAAARLAIEEAFDVLVRERDGTAQWLRVVQSMAARDRQRRALAEAALAGIRNPSAGD